MGRIKNEIDGAFFYYSSRYDDGNNKNPGGTKTDAKTFRDSIRISLSSVVFQAAFTPLRDMGDTRRWTPTQSGLSLKISLIKCEFGGTETDDDPGTT